MLYKLPEETLMLQETVRRFVENELIPLETKFPERPNSYELPDEEFLKLTAKVHEMGYDWGQVQGAGYWCYQGKTLRELVSEKSN